MTTDEATRPRLIKVAMSRLQARPTARGGTGEDVPAGAPAGAEPVAAGPVAADGPADPARPVPVLVSLRFLRAALRRRRLVWLTCALLGLLAGGAFLTVVPSSNSASATLLLSRASGADPARASATDLGLLQMRPIAERVVATLDLDLTAEDLLKTVKADPSTSDLLTLRMSGPNRPEAVRRLTAFCQEYLAFRAAQVAAQSDVLISGYNDRIKDLQGQVDRLGTRIDALGRQPDDGSGRLGDAVTERAQLEGRIETLQQSIEEETLRRSAVVSASRVIDPPTAQTGGQNRRLALALASGLIGGTVLGMGAVVLAALLSQRLRSRAEVALALEAPVMASVGRLAATTSRARNPLRRKRSGLAEQAEDLRRASTVIQHVLPAGPVRPRRLVVACVDNADEARFAAAAAAIAIQAQGTSVRLVDLTLDGQLQPAVAALMPGTAVDHPQVHRPGGAGAAGESVLTAILTEPVTAAVPGNADVVLVLAEVTAATGAYHLADWAGRALVVVTSGRSDAERVRATGDLIRAAGMELAGAVLLRTDPRDTSAGSYVAAGVHHP